MMAKIKTVSDLIKEIGNEEFSIQLIMEEKGYSREVSKKLYDIWMSAGDGFPSLLSNIFTLGEDESAVRRVCSHCGMPIVEGYCINNGESYYCSDECLHEHMTQEEYLELYDEGNGDSYWTEWGLYE